MNAVRGIGGFENFAECKKGLNNPIRRNKMNIFISKAALEARRARYKKGARVELISMTDPYTKLKSGDTGTVDFVDDTGTVFIIWDSGSHLGVVFGEDEIRLI